VASSRLVYAVARDGVLPMSSWVGRVTPDGQPKNAVTVIYIFAAILLCTIIPSNVAFTSLVSAAGVPTIAAYGLIALLRLTATPNQFRSSHLRLGIFAKPFYVATVFFNGVIFAVNISPLRLYPGISLSSVQVMISPFYFPVDAASFNFVSYMPYLEIACQQDA
jgi:translation initiation factor 5B